MDSKHLQDSTSHTTAADGRGRTSPERADTRASILDSDPRTGDLIGVMALWERAVGTEHVEVGEIARRAIVSSLSSVPAETVTRAPAVELRDKLVEVTSGGEVWNGKRVGWWLRRHAQKPQKPQEEQVVPMCA